MASGPPFRAAQRSPTAAVPATFPARLRFTAPAICHGRFDAPGFVVARPNPHHRVKLHLDRPGGINVITAFDGHAVRVNQIAYRESLIVLRDRVVEAWGPASATALEAPHFDLLAELGAEIVLLGTGPKLRFPHPRLSARLLSQRIGLEVMDTGAACRTYNILSGEGRNVAAALLFA